MIQIHQMKISVNKLLSGFENSKYDEDLLFEIEKKILLDDCSKLLKLPKELITDFIIERKSMDARKKPDLFYVYTVVFSVPNEERILKRNKNVNVSAYKKKNYEIKISGTELLENRPVIVGFGPAGLFSAYLLAKLGYRPIIVERGKKVDERIVDVNNFWNNSKLLSNSNVQFGEGGAGTFSDGKLNTLIKDKTGRNKEVLKVFVECGAPTHILYDHKPHIGTDILLTVVKNMREKILSMGGEIHYETQMTDLLLEDGKIKAIELNYEKILNCSVVILAIGHSARDTFYKLYERKVPMDAKDFAVGFRVQHRQRDIDLNQYGDCPYNLPAASYKLATKTQNGRSVYSFCMCPGGYVVNASSEEKRLAINGMSYSGRDSGVANSAIIVSVNRDDFMKISENKEVIPALAGVEFQRIIEEKAYKLADGAIPIQYFDDFSNKRKSTAERDGVFAPAIKGAYQFSDLTVILPDELNDSFIEAMHNFSKSIEGFDNENSYIAAVESRTSSPVRIHRNSELESEVIGLYPCGEGAGYAGGITSAAMDGLAVAEAIAKKYIP